MTYKHAKKPPIVWFIIALALFVLGVIGFGLYKSYATPKTLQLQGQVHSDTTNVATKLPSRVAIVHVKEGQTVAQGELLITLTSPEIETKKKQATASLQSAKARQRAVERGVRDENVESLYANWQAAQAQAALATDTASRSDYLYQEGVISRLRRDEMTAASISATALANSAKAQYLKAKNGRTDETKDSIDAQVQIAQAMVDEAAALESETRLHAPIDGTISQLYAKQGELVIPSAPLATLIDNHPHISLNVPESAYAFVYQKPILTGYVPALGQSFDFSITHIDAEGDFATIKSTKTSGYDVRSFKLTLAPAAPIHDLRSGMSVLFDIALQ